MKAHETVLIGHQPAADRTGAGRVSADGTGGRQRGMTLVEIMVALVIGLLLAIVAGTVFVASRQSFRVQDNFAQLQEGGRAVLEDVSKEIRKAGSYGCFKWKGTTPGAAVTAKLDPDAASAAAAYRIPVVGGKAALDQNYDVRGGPVTGLTLPTGSGITLAAGTDYVQIMYGQPIANLADDALAFDPTGQAPLTLNHGITAGTGQPFLLSDCDSMTLFRVDSAATGAAGTPLLHAPPTNNVVAPVNQHPKGSTLMVFQVVAFFVGTDANGVKNLYRWEVPGNTMPQPLVANVEDMRVIFGVDGGAGTLSTVSAWLSGGSVTAWERVLTVAVHVLMRSNDGGLASTPISFSWDSSKKIFVQGTSGSDFYVRRPYVINAVIRSRAPIMMN